MSKKTIPLYGGAIRAHKLGAFVRGGETFHVIRPGYDIQGQRRIKWTQFVHEDVPIFQVKLDVGLDAAMEAFDKAFEAVFAGPDLAKLPRALESAKAEHRRKFKDGVSGLEAAPSVTADPAGPGSVYPA